jgi:hypothetical protein
MRRTLGPMKLTFLGAVGTVTGSKYLFKYAGRRLQTEAVRKRCWRSPARARSCRATAEGPCVEDVGRLARYALISAISFAAPRTLIARCRL